MPKEPSENVVAAWIALIRAQKTSLQTVEQAFKQQGLPPLAWYDVLWELEQAQPDALRPFELEQRLLMPQYGLSRLLDRIRDAGYLERRPSAADGRGFDIAITAAGRAIRKKMWPVYAAALNRALGARLSDAEAKKLATLLEKLGRSET